MAVVTISGLSSGSGLSRSFAVMVSDVSESVVGISITVSMAVVTISGLSSGSGLSRSFAVMVSNMSVSIRISITISMAVSISVSGLSGSHGGKGNKGKSDTLHNAADYDYVSKSCDGADDLCRTAIAVPKFEPVYIPFFYRLEC